MLYYISFFNKLIQILHYIWMWQKILISKKNLRGLWMDCINFETKFRACIFLFNELLFSKYSTYYKFSLICFHFLSFCILLNWNTRQDLTIFSIKKMIKITWNFCDMLPTKNFFEDFISKQKSRTKQNKLYFFNFH